MKIYQKLSKQKTYVLIFLVILITISYSSIDSRNVTDEQWSNNSQNDWPQITMINEIEYVDKFYPIGGCGFLLDIGHDTLAITAKHVIMFFKSESMKSVSFSNTLKQWKMFPKNNPDDLVIIDKLLNEDSLEYLTDIPASKDWLLFTIKVKSLNIQPLKMRTSPMVTGEPVFIIGWRYSDRDCPQVVYEGNFVKSEDSTILITTKDLSDNTMPGLSGSPVIDAQGFLIGIMSQKADKMERLSSIEYPKSILEKTKLKSENGKQ